MAINAYARGQGIEDHLAMFELSLWLSAATVLFSMIVAVVAGVYPALRAARVDPIPGTSGKVTNHIPSHNQTGHQQYDRNLDSGGRFLLMRGSTQ